MSLPCHCPSRPGRMRRWAVGGILLASALLVGCGGGGGGAAKPAKPTIQTSLWEGTITLQGGSKLEVLAAILADSATTGTVRLVSIDNNDQILPYQITGSFTLNDSAITSNGSLTVFAPAGTTFAGNATTTCTLAGTLANNTMTGTLSGTSFNGTFTMEPETLAATSLDQAAGTYVTIYPFLSDGNDGTLALAADGTFTGSSYPRGTVGNPMPDPSTAIGTLTNGTAQMVAGSQNIARINATQQGGPGSTPSDYSGLGVVGVIDGKVCAVIMADNGSSSLAGFFAKP